MCAGKLHHIWKFAATYEATSDFCYLIWSVRNPHLKQYVSMLPG